MRLGDPDGFGRYGRVEHTDDGLVCHDCGRAFHQLSTHARMAHDYPDAASYREAHGLKRTERLVSRKASTSMSDSWEKHRDLHLKALESRDWQKAVDASHQVDMWSPAARESRQEQLKARKGRQLTEQETAWLSEAIPMDEWCARARKILEDPTVSRPSMSRSLGLADSTVSARLRRYPD